MHKYTHFSPLLTAYPLVLLCAALGAVLAVLLSFTQPLLYSSTTKVLIAPKLGTSDAYTVGRSAELIADNLSTILSSSSFYDQVFSTTYAIDRSYFPTDVLKFRKKWAKTVEAHVSRASGILTVSAFHTKASQAELLARAVAEVYVTKGWTYVQGIEIAAQVIDEPVNSRYPVRPNIVVNAFSGLFLGEMAGGAYVLIEAERIRRRHQIVHE